MQPTHCIPFNNDPNKCYNPKNMALSYPQKPDLFGQYFAIEKLSVREFLKNQSKMPFITPLFKHTFSITEILHFAEKHKHTLNDRIQFNIRSLFLSCSKLVSPNLGFTNMQIAFSRFK